ncbi:MAG: tetratricopeptide repeat protein [Burkholderiaceae bacterium]
MKRTIEPNIIDRCAALPSGEGADSPPNDQGRNSPAVANAGSPVPHMVGGSTVGGQTPLPVEGLASVTGQSPSSVASSAGFGGMLVGPMSNPQLMVRTSNESDGSSTSTTAHVASPMHPSASSLRVVPPGEVEEPYQLGLQAYETDDFKQAAMWFQQAAEQGHADAQYYLGLIYQYGRGIKEDYDKAIALYKKAAEQGHVKAQFELASIYEDDDGIEDHMGQAVKWYLKAAEQGHVSAQSNLGYFYHSGIGVEQNFEQAVMWYQKAVDKDDDEARELLGFMYAEGEGVKQDFYKAAYLQMLGNLQNSDGDQKSVALHDEAHVENGSILDYILDVLRDYPEFKGVTRVKIREFTSTEVSCSAVDRLIRSDSDIQKLWIVFPDPKFNRFKTGDTTAVDATDFVKKFAESIRVTNTRLTHLNFSESFQDAFVDDAALAILNQVLHRNKSIAKLRGYLQQHPAVHSDELPLEVLMPLADQLIVHGCRSGQSRGAVKAALDEFLMSVQAGRLNVPVRQPVQ